MKSWLILGLLLGLAMVASGQNTASIAKLEEAVRSSPNSAEAWYKLGVGKFGRTWVDDAKLAFEKAIELKPDYAEAHVALGAWYLRPKRRCALGADLTTLKTEHQSRASLAVGVLEKAVELKPAYPAAFVYLGQAYARIEKADKAAEAFETAIDQGVGVPWVRVDLANLYQKLGRNQDAINLYRSVTGKVVPASGAEIDKRATANSFDSLWIDRAYRELADLYATLERYDEALETYREIIRFRADDAGIHYKLGLLFIRLGDKQSAEREYRALKRIAAGTKHEYSRKEIRRDAKELLDRIRKSQN